MPSESVDTMEDDSAAVLVVDNGDAARPPSASVTTRNTSLATAPEIIDKRKKQDLSKQPRPVPNSVVGTDAPVNRHHAFDSANGPASTLSKELREQLPERRVQAEEERVLDKSKQHRSDSCEPSSSKSTAPPPPTSSSMLAPSTLHMSLLQAQAASHPEITKPTMPGLEVDAKVATGNPTLMSVSEEVLAERRNEIRKAAVNGRLSLNWGPSFAPDVDSVPLVLDSEICSFSFRDLFPRIPVLVSCGFSFQGERTFEKTYHYEDIESAFGQTECNGVDIHLCFIEPYLDVLRASNEFGSIWRGLDLPPSLMVHILGGGGLGLGRRMSIVSSREAQVADSVSFYYLWSLLTVVGLSRRSERENPRGWRKTPDGVVPVFIQAIKAWLIEEYMMISLRVDLATREVKVVVSCDDVGETRSRLLSCCVGDKRLNVRDDPFILFCCAYSAIMDIWAVSDKPISAFLKTKERFCLSLSEDAGKEDEDRIKATARDLRQLLPFLAWQLESFECLCRTVTELIDEHRNAKDFLKIPDIVFLRVEKNLQTVCSWANSVKGLLESRFRMIDMCLSTLSAVTGLKNDRAVSENTHHMARMADYSREENISMSNIARAAKLDSEAMKTIATMTMLYLPATFVATVFSMGLFHFDFDDGKSGDVGISRYWWMYLVVAVPLSAATFWAFSWAVKSQKNASVKNSQKATTGA